MGCGERIKVFCDPWVPEFKNMYGIGAKGIPELTPEIVKDADLVMVTAGHHNVDYQMVQKNAKVIFDTKNVMANINPRDNIETL